MRDILLLKRSETEKSPVLENINVSIDEIYRFMDNSSEIIRAMPSEKYFVVDMDVIKASAKEIACVILNEEEEKYKELSIIALQ